MSKEYFVKFSCPSYSNVEVVLEDLRKLLESYKCSMTECGDIETLSRVMFRRSTGACAGRPIPPKYTKKVSEDFNVKG